MGRPLASSWEKRKAAQRAALEAKARHKAELFRAAMERKRAAEATEREEAFQQLYSDVLGGLQHGAGVLTETQEVLEYADNTQHARREALYQQWQHQVFEPMQERLQQAMSQRSVSDLEASLQAASQAYVQATNTKRLFRDVIIEDDYNPLAPLSSSIRIPTSDLADPLLHDLLKTQAEKSLLPTCGGSSSSSMGGRQGCVASSGGSCGGQPGQLSSKQGCQPVSSCYGLAKATARPMLETARWAAGQIHATPYGHCIDDHTAEYIIRPAAPLSLAQKASHIFFDDFSPTT